MTAQISFHPAQSSIAIDTHRFRVLCCGRRFGKTTLAVWEMVGAAVAHSGKKIAYLAPTYQQARDIAWAELKKICSPIALDINESRLEIKIRTQDIDSPTDHEGEPPSSIIVLRGWESVETLRGQKFDLLVLDEVASMRNFFTGWDEVLSPTLIDNKGSAMFISTPKGFNHFYDLFKFEAKNPDYKSFHYTTYDNPHIPKEEIERERLTKTEDAFAQEYMADFRKTEGLVYKEFDRKKHVVSKSQLPPAFSEIIAGVDFGFTHPCAVIFIGKDRDSRYFIFQEWYHRGKTDAEIAEYVAAQRFQRVYPDPENAAAREELKRRGVNMRDVNKGPGSIVAGINIVRELFKSNRLYISAECENTILELETYSYAESKNTRDPKENPAKEFDDAMDACFVSGTLIVTEDGEKPIETLKVGEKVLTRNGFKKIRAVFSNGEKEVWSIGNLTGTANHPIWKEGEGFVPLASLSYGDMIGICTPIIIEEKQGKFGNPKTDQSLQSTISITKMAIKATILSRILNAYQNWITKDFTGIKNHLLRKYVLLAQKNLRQNYFMDYFAQTPANRKAGEPVRSILNKKYVKNVKKFSEQISTQRQDFVQNSVLQESMNANHTRLNAESVEKTSKQDMVQTWHFHVAPVVKTPTMTGREEVFNLSVEDEEEYFAERVLVHNCRYALMTDSANNSSRGPSVAYSPHRAYGMETAWDKPNQNTQSESKGFTIAHSPTQGFRGSDVWDVKP